MPKQNPPVSVLPDFPAVPVPVDRSASPLPDIAQDMVALVGGRLDRVGMAGIEVALRTKNSNGEIVITPARATAQVALDDPNAKGIHMSRLFLALQNRLEESEFDVCMVVDLLNEFVSSHHDLSQSAYLEFRFEYLARRASLLSNHVTWRSYPIRIEAEMANGQIQHRIHVSVAYSSTCPCSAALARQLLQQQFQEDYGNHRWLSVAEVMRWLGTQGTLATPHSQRSHADVTVVLEEAGQQYPLAGLIECVEAAVATPVQAAVKRRDEQEFARLNGENLMFCEDSARRIRAALEQMHGIADYRVKASHLESLHPHDAVAVVVKGVPGGLQA